MITGASAAASYFAPPPAKGRAGSPAGTAQAPLAAPGIVKGAKGAPEGTFTSRRGAPVSRAVKSGGAGEKLTEEQKRQVQELKRRDTQVRAHESAHSSAGGSYTSAPSFEFTTGPDAKRYATSGEVQIDASPVRDNPRATIRKMDVVIRAATAPADPSSRDLQVARKAQAERSKASAELFTAPGDASTGGQTQQPLRDPSLASLALLALGAYGGSQEGGRAGAYAREPAGLSIFA